MAITEFIVTFSVFIIGKIGLPGVAFLMVFESMVFPVPSEAVMPFAGFLWFQGRVTGWEILIWSTLGSLVGSLISYYIGYYFGEIFIKRWGKYAGLNEHHLEQTKNFFNRFGDKTVFVSRFIPIIRHLISIPAGAGKMSLPKFVIYTVIGAGLWNMFLAWIGFHLGSRWETVRHYSESLDIIFVIAILAAAWYFWRKLRREAQQKKTSP